MLESECSNLIPSLSAAAEAVLDRCMKTNKGYDLNKTMSWVYFNYEFLDDVCVRHPNESLIEWMPKFSAKHHPLAQMVSLFECIKFSADHVKGGGIVQVWPCF